MKNEGELTPLPLKTMAERTQNIQRVSLEFLSERMKNEELRETDAHSFLMTMAERTETFKSISVEFLSERMKDEE